MPIEVRHDPPYAVTGQAAAAMGQTAQLRQQQDLQLRNAQLQLQAQGQYADQYARREQLYMQAAQAERQRQFQAQQAELDAQRQAQQAGADFQQRMFLLENQQQHQEQMSQQESQQQQERWKYQWTAQQEHEINQLNQAEQTVKQWLAQGRLSMPEAQHMLMQVEAQRAGMSPQAVPQQPSPYPKGQGIGDIWTVTVPHPTAPGGAVPVMVSREQDGSLRPFVTPNQLGNFGGSGGADGQTGTAQDMSFQQYSTAFRSALDSVVDDVANGTFRIEEFPPDVQEQLYAAGQSGNTTEFRRIAATYRLRQQMQNYEAFTGRPAPAMPPGMGAPGMGQQTPGRPTPAVPAGQPQTQQPQQPQMPAAPQAQPQQQSPASPFPAMPGLMGLGQAVGQMPQGQLAQMGAVAGGPYRGEWTETHDRQLQGLAAAFQQSGNQRGGAVVSQITQLLQRYGDPARMPPQVRQVYELLRRELDTLIQRAPGWTRSQAAPGEGNQLPVRNTLATILSRPLFPGIGMGNPIR